MAVILDPSSSNLNLSDCEIRTTNLINDCKQLHVCRIRSYSMGWTSFTVCGSSEKLEIELENADGKSVSLGRRRNLILGLCNNELV